MWHLQCSSRVVRGEFGWLVPLGGQIMEAVTTSSISVLQVPKLLTLLDHVLLWQHLWAEDCLGHSPILVMKKLREYK